MAEVNKGWVLFCENNSYVIGADDRSGGVCGRNDGLVYGCSNTGYVLWGGGVVGMNGFQATVDSCWNQGYAASTGFAAAGVVTDNYGWVINCYNAGTVSGTITVNTAKTVGGVVGENQVGSYRIKNCYNIGWLDIDEENNWYMPGAICGGNAPGDTNSYTTDTPYNRGAEILSREDFGTEEMISRLQNGSPYMKWCLDEDSLNGGNVIPIAQQDKKMACTRLRWMSGERSRKLPEVWQKEHSGWTRWTTRISVWRRSSRCIRRIRTYSLLRRTVW